MILTIVLLAILSFSAVSAQESNDNITHIDDSPISVSQDETLELNTENDDSLSINSTSGSSEKNVYVETDGDDTGSGSEYSPYATINKAISSVNASDNAIIHLGSGSFVGENNTDLNINLAHKNYGGSLTFIGSSEGDTIIDANHMGQIFKSISADSIVTLMNITFINGKANTGSAIVNSGDLTIDNCVFTNNSASAYAAVYQTTANNLKIMNSEFINNIADSGNANIYYSVYGSVNSNVTIIDCIFENATTSYSYADSSCVYIQCPNILVQGNVFINTRGTGKGTALYVRSDNLGKVIDNYFEDCSYDGSNDGAILYIGGIVYLEGNTFENFTSTKNAPIFALMNYNAYLTFNDVTISGTSITLTCNLTDDQDNMVNSYYKVKFYLNGTYLGETSATNGVASLTVAKLLDNGEYELTGSYGSDNPLECEVIDGIVTVDFDHNPLDLWIAPDGDDVNGTGSESNPFKTIKHALDYGFTNSVDVTLHMKNGLYNETDDLALSYSNTAKLNIIGESYGNVIISGNNNKGFFTLGATTEAYFKNLKFVNGTGTSSRSFNVRYLTMENCIVDNIKQLYAQNNPSHVVFKNVTWTNTAQIQIYNAEIYDSHFENITSSGTGNLWLATVSDDDFIIIENSKFINMKCTGSSGAGVAYIQGNLRSVNNRYESNMATRSYGVLYVSANIAISINDTFINNHADADYGVGLITNRNDNAQVLISGAQFINNTAGGNGGAIGIYGGEIIDCVFTDNIAEGNGGAIFTPTHTTSVYLTDIKLTDVSFSGNDAANGKDIYITPSTNTNNLFCNLEGLTVTFNNLTTKVLEDVVTASVTHTSGAVVGGGVVTFFLDGVRMGEATVVNGVAKLDYLGFKNNGTFTLSGSYNVAPEDTVYNTATVTVTLDPLKDNVTFYVSDSLGDDTTGDGSLAKPYKTIQTALNNAYKQSSVIVIRVLEGTYTNELNTNLTVASSLDISIIGDGQNATLIDGRDLDWFLNILSGDGIVKIADMTVANVTKNYVDAKLYNQHPAISIEKGANLIIDNVGFIRCHGTEGGAIFSEGNLLVNNSYFFNNGDSNYGAAIKSTGTLTIYDSVFIANHAKYYSTIYNEGRMFLYNSLIQDSMRVNGWTGNAMVIGGAGNITMVNSTIMRSGKTSNELIGTGQTWNNNPGFAISIGSTGNVKVIDSIIDGNNVAYSAQYISNVAFGGSGSIGVFVPYGLEVINTKILNLKDILSGSKGTNYLDSCYIENVTYVSEGTSYDFNLTIVNSYFADGTTMVTKKATANVILDNNWWGSNDQPTYKVGSTVTNATKWLIVTLDVNTVSETSQEVILAFKSTDGENITDIEGVVPSRDFTITATNATLSLSNGTLKNVVVIPFEISKDISGYNITAVVDNQKIDLIKSNPTITATSQKIFVGSDVIVEIACPDDLLKNFTVIVNGNEYVGVVNGSSAIAVIPNLAVGNYTATVVYSGDERYFAKTIKTDVKVLGIVMTAPNVEKYFSGEEKLNIVVTDTDGNPIANQNVTVSIDGTSTSAISNRSGIATVNLDLNVGTYTAIISLNSTTISANVTIKTTIMSSDMKKAYNSGVDFTATLFDKEGNRLANTTVKVKVGNKEYTITTDENGVLKLNKKLAVGTYIVSLTNPATLENATNTVKIVKRLTGNKNIAMGYFDGTSYKVRAYDNNGNVVGANQIVKIKLNKKTYNVKTNKNGYAILKIPNTVKPGIYAITATYKGMTVKNTVKVLQVLKSQKTVAAKKSAKKLVLKATLKKGKTAYKNKVVSFKFLGKTYKAKTNAKGIAQVTIKNNVISKLKVGKKYGVSITYLKDTIKTTVVAKK